MSVTSSSTTQKNDQRFRPLSRRRTRVNTLERTRTSIERRRHYDFELNGAVIKSQTSLNLRARKPVSRADSSSSSQRQRKTSNSSLGDDKTRRKRRRRRRFVFVDTSRARTATEVVRLAIQQLGPEWKEMPRGQRNGCQIYWNGLSYNDSAMPITSGKVNKFPGMLEILRKVKFSQIIHKMQMLFPGEYDFYPKTWLLPTELSQFLKEAKITAKRQRKRYYIVKPDNSSQGDGIYLIRNPYEMKSVALKPVVVQEYISDPLLIDNKKFDLRIYVVLKSIEPLEFYLCREGMARLCTEDYNEPSEKNLHQVFMHLTNYSLNKRSSSFIQSDDVTEGSKRTLTSVLNYLELQKYDVAKFWRDLEDVVCKTMLAITPELKIKCHTELPRSARKSGPSCFQILGLDVLLTSTLKPYLLEVNASPSLSLASERLISPGVYESIPSPVDQEIKIPLVRDTLLLMNPRNRKMSLATPSFASSDDFTDDESIDAFSQLSLEVQVDESAGTIVAESCLEELFPVKYGRRLRFKNMRVFERIGNIFIHFIGYHGNRMGQSSFRKFTRTCKLCINGFSSAAVDIMYIDISRRWNSLLPSDLSAGLCYNGFVEAFTVIADRKFASIDSQLERVLALVDLCESYLALY